MPENNSTAEKRGNGEKRMNRSEIKRAMKWDHLTCNCNFTTVLFDIRNHGNKLLLIFIKCPWNSSFHFSPLVPVSLGHSANADCLVSGTLLLQMWINLFHRPGLKVQEAAVNSTNPSFVYGAYTVTAVRTITICVHTTNVSNIVKQKYFAYFAIGSGSCILYRWVHNFLKTTAEVQHLTNAWEKRRKKKEKSNRLKSDCAPVTSRVF